MPDGVVSGSANGFALPAGHVGKGSFKPWPFTVANVDSSFLRRQLVHGACAVCVYWGGITWSSAARHRQCASPAARSW
jgi:hypothetical protein